MQLKDYIFCGEDLMSVIALLQELKSVRDSCKVKEGALMWLFKKYLEVHAESAIKAQVTLPTSVNCNMAAL